MNEFDTLLHPLFIHLRRADIPLGIDDYRLALEVLRSGMGLEDPQRLKSTCRLLWAKSRADQIIFDQAYALLVEPQLKTRPIIPPPPPPPPPPNRGRKRRDLDTTINRDKSDRQSTPEAQTSAPQAAALPITPSVTERLAKDAPKSKDKYQLTPRPPISRREIITIWRYLRQPQRTGPLLDLDIEATADSIACTGFFLRPVLQARRRNQASLIMLIDRSEWMLAFDQLIYVLVDSIQGGGLLASTTVYYFQTYPGSSLSRRPNLTISQPLEETLATEAKDNRVLIISDAGAAQGIYSSRRVDHTRNFLRILRNYTYLYAWLNPLPAQRWQKTSAEEIAQMAPMFPFTREGLIDAVNILRGRPFPVGVSLHG